MDIAPRPDDLPAWRKQLRTILVAKRSEMPLADQRRCDERITELLLGAFPLLRGLTIGFYWPFKGEVDARIAVHRFRGRGSRTALPVVVAKGAPLEFRVWGPGVETRPGVFGLPVPESPAVTPDAVLMPPVGVDRRGYRLGYGGGYFDRTLACLSPQPLKIGLAREVSRIDTIHPQPHDIPMDFLVTEAGLWAATDEGLREIEPEAANARAVEIRKERSTMSQGELTSLLNTLLEVERAGAKVVSAYLDDLSVSTDVRARLIEIQRDECRNSAVLVRMLRRVRAEPSKATGEFLQMAVTIQGIDHRLEFLNRGQAWVAQHIAAALPRIADPVIRAEMRAMQDSHLANIDVCREILGEKEQPCLARQ